MKKFILIFSALFICFNSFNVLAEPIEKVTVTWADTDKFADIRADYTGVTQYRKHVIYNINKHFKKLVKKLPEGQTLKVTINDIDLAGDIRMFDGRLIRVIKQNNPPRIAFSYQVLNVNNDVVSEGEEDIRDTNFFHSKNSRYKNRALGFEKHLLDKWFKKTFPSK